MIMKGICFILQGTPLWLETKEMLQFDDFRIIKETENAKEELQLTLNHTVRRTSRFYINISLPVRLKIRRRVIIIII